MIQKIPLYKRDGTIRDYALIDSDDFCHINQWKWHLDCDGYARRSFKINGKKISLLMHREINKTPIGFETDHINLIKIDNRKQNLRTCSKSENMANRKIKSGSKLKYKGVCEIPRASLGGKRFFVQLYKNKKMYSAGCFFTEEEAGIAYNKLAIEHHGEFARLNVICG